MKKNVLVFIILAICLIFALSCGKKTTDPAIVYDIRNISSYSELKTLTAEINNGADTSKMTITVTSDFDITDNSYVPIGTNPFAGGHLFQGTFDGGGHTITMTVNKTDVDYVALIGFIGNSAHIKNVTVAGNISGRENIAGIAAVINGLAIIENCKNEAAITATGQYSAGIVSLITVPTPGTVIIKNVTNIGDITGKSIAGGICGGVLEGGGTYSLEIGPLENTGSVNVNLGIKGTILGMASKSLNYQCIGWDINDLANVGQYK